MPIMLILIDYGDGDDDFVDIGDVVVIVNDDNEVVITTATTSTTSEIDCANNVIDRST
jgi:hypothetical protein